MAEEYSVGQNRIFYRPRGFVSGMNIKVEMVDPNLDTEDFIELTEVEDKGLYYFEYVFSVVGTYIGIFYENEVKFSSKAFGVKKGPKRGIGGGVGPQVVNQ